MGAFARASDALAAALDAQRALTSEVWPDGISLKVRMAVNTGEAVQRDEGNYVGTAIIRTARIRNAAHGGQILVGDSSAAVAADALPPGSSLVDLGSHRLKDLARPTRIWQLAHPDLPIVDAALRSLDAYRHNLPSQATPLIGRHVELRSILHELDNEQLVTLTGSGGVGKTRLAAQIGAEIVDRFTGGVWWVDLAPLADGASIGPRLLSAIGASEDGMRPALAIATDRLAAAPAVVIFDNCEHLVADVADVIETLRRACPDLVVLATSREPLGLPGEVTWRVPSLALPPRHGPVDIASLSQYDSVRLFLDRARRARPQLALTDVQAAAVAEICFRLDGVALAIELAAARCRQLSPERIAADLTDRFRLLTGGARTLLPRQQTLLASVEWSHDLLDDDERVVLRRLAVFAGPFVLEAAEAVAAFDGCLDRWSVLDVVGRLVDKSLVQLGVDESIEDGEVVGPSRYRLLETVRQFAIERARQADELAALRDAHADWWIASLDAIDARQPTEAVMALTGGFAVDVCAALDWLEPDFARRYKLLSLVALAWDWGGHTDLTLAYVDRWIAQGPVAGHETAWAVAFGACGTSIWTGFRHTTWVHVPLAFKLIDELGDGRAAIGLSFLVILDRASGPVLLKRAFQLAIKDDCGVLLGPVSHLFHTFIADHDRTAANTIRLASEAAAGRASLLQPIWLTDGLPRDDRNPYGVPSSLPSRGPDVHATSFLQHRLLHATYLVGGALTHGRTDSFDEFLPFIQQYAHIPIWAFIGAATTSIAKLVRGAPLTRAEVASMRNMAAAAEAGWRFLNARALVSVDGADLADELIDSLAGPGSATVVRPLIDSAVALHEDRVLDAERLIAEAVLAEQSWMWDDLRPDLIETSAIVAGRVADHSRAMRLMGAAIACREGNGIGYRWRDQERWLGEVTAAARAAIGSDVVDAEIARGGAMSSDDALALAIRGRGDRKRPSSGWDSLTPTELQVCALIAEGRTNPEIAERLLMGRTTVKTHVTHALAKLGVTSRAELAAAVARRQG